MSACSFACGYCGRCTEAWERTSRPAALELCDECHGAAVTYTLAGVGQFCSRRCADIGEAKFLALAKRRGWTETQPDLLAHASGENKR